MNRTAVGVLCVYSATLWSLCPSTDGTQTQP